MTYICVRPQRRVTSMKPKRKRTGQLIAVVAGWVLAEAVSVYALTFLFMLEGQPQRHGDPRLQAWGWVWLGAMLLELVVASYLVIRICRA